MSNPAIVLISADHADVLEEQFWRYSREYDVRVAASAQEAKQLVMGMHEAGIAICLFVADSRLPDADVRVALMAMREVVPTARRMVAADWSNFRDDAEKLRPGLASGKYDAYVLLPRGIRDEEFHSTVLELLNDWNATVAVPEVVAVRIISPVNDAGTLAMRDYLERIGTARPGLPARLRGRARRAGSLPRGARPVAGGRDLRA